MGQGSEAQEGLGVGMVLLQPAQVNPKTFGVPSHCNDELHLQALKVLSSAVYTETSHKGVNIQGWAKAGQK